MKKMYKQPETEVAAVNTARLMDTATMSTKENGNGIMEAPSRGGRTMFED
ncbi:MAG: hypothetical protein IJ718_05415 [Paludibacteraceae bacterium]|nr:hypothetical protein [Paludibacteraceae bacterium]